MNLSEDDVGISRNNQSLELYSTIIPGRLVIHTIGMLLSFALPKSSRDKPKYENG